MTASKGPFSPDATRPRTVLLAFVVFLLIVGLPAILYALAGQMKVALGLLALFVAMLLLSAYALREAVKAKRAEMEKEQDG
jgi:membrane protein implicated in regulation of membrane protease activity